VDIFLINFVPPQWGAYFFFLDKVSGFLPKEGRSARGEEEGPTPRSSVVASQNGPCSWVTRTMAPIPWETFSRTSSSSRFGPPQREEALKDTPGNPVQANDHRLAHVPRSGLSNWWRRCARVRGLAKRPQSQMMDRQGQARCQEKGDTLQVTGTSTCPWRPRRCGPRWRRCWTSSSTRTRRSFWATCTRPGWPCARAIWSPPRRPTGPPWPSRPRRTPWWAWVTCSRTRRTSPGPRNASWAP